MTLHLPEDSPVLNLPWIITFGPLAEDEDWEPVVSGPYERAHALDEQVRGAGICDANARVGRHSGCPDGGGQPH